MANVAEFFGVILDAMNSNVPSKLFSLETLHKEQELALYRSSDAIFSSNLSKTLTLEEAMDLKQEFSNRLEVLLPGTGLYATTNSLNRLLSDALEQSVVFKRIELIPQ